MEVLAEGDVRTRLREVLGVIGIRQVANAIPLQEARDTPDRALDAILVHFGFTIPGPLPRGGPFQAITELRLARDGLKQMSYDLNKITSEITRAALAVQGLLRTSVFGWAQLIFGKQRDDVLLETVLPSNLNALLARLSFGDVDRLWRELPNRIGAEALPDNVIAKFGRVGIRLACRRAEGNREASQPSQPRSPRRFPEISETQIGVVRTKALSICKEVLDAIPILVASRAIIRIAVPTREFSRPLEPLELFAAVRRRRRIRSRVHRSTEAR